MARFSNNLHTLILLIILLTQLSFSQNAKIIVQQGDTLWGLAEQYGTTVEAILELNGLTGTDLFPGALLVLPTSSTASLSIYTVQEGDTLYDIAIAYNLSLDDLIAFNNLDGTVIKPGQDLAVTAPQALPEPLTISVQAGDSLWSLAKTHEVSIDLIREANSLTTDVLQPGDSLRIPGRYAASSSGEDIGGAVPMEITVAKGDTLWEIAKRYNTTISVLMSSNELASETIRSGQILRVLPSSEVVRAGPIVPETPITAAMVWPIVGKITSRYGYRQLRMAGSNMHTGLDIDGETGDPIYAAVAGQVMFSGWRAGYGNLIIIQSGETEYYYGHASELLVGEGASVVTGQLIGKIGSTGRSTGSHLHFEIRVGGAHIDPLPILEQNATLQ